jgi:hypothetical protein
MSSSLWGGEGFGIQKNRSSMDRVTNENRRGQLSAAGEGEERTKDGHTSTHRPGEALKRRLETSLLSIYTHYY